jgi:hypothetical protein
LHFEGKISIQKELKRSPPPGIERKIRTQITERYMRNEVKGCTVRKQNYILQQKGKEDCTVYCNEKENYNKEGNAAFDKGLLNGLETVKSKRK